MKTFITGKEAQLLLEITTRQQLRNIVVKNSIETKSLGAGKPNIYLKSDIEKYLKKPKTSPKAQKTNKKLIVKKKKQIEVKKAVRKKQLENKPKPIPKQKTVEEIISSESEKNINKIFDNLAEKGDILTGDGYSAPINTPDNKKLDNEDFNPLNAIGQAEFLRVERLAKANGTYEDLDQSLLLFYSISYQKYINAVVKSEELDDLTMNDAGEYKVHPYFQVADKCFTHMSKIAVMLGIGVRNRIGIESKKKEKKNISDVIAEAVNNMGEF